MSIALVSVMLMMTTFVAGFVNDRVTESVPTLLALLVAAMSALIVGSSSPKSREFLLHGLVVSAMGVALAGIFGVVAHFQPLALVDGGLWRAASTLTYANATAAVLGAALPTAITFAEHRSAVGRRERVSVVAITAGLLLTGSRAGIAAAVVGLIAFGGFAGWSILRRSLPSLAAGLTLFAGAAISMPAERSASAPQRVAALLAAAVAAAVILRLSAGRTSAVLGRQPARKSSWPMRAGVMISAVALGTLVALFSRSAIRDRLSLQSPSRVEEWAAAIRLFRSSPIVGVGPGPMELELRGTTLRMVAFAHNEYLQLLAQQGLFGVGALVAGSFLVFHSLRASFVRRSLLQSSALGGCVVLGLHAAFDYILHLPAIVVGAAMLLALVARREEKHDGVEATF